jgi:predicted transglutaminase-like cysteine proteinase
LSFAVVPSECMKIRRYFRKAALGAALLAASNVAPSASLAIPAPDLFGTVALPAPAMPMAAKWAKVRTFEPSSSIQSLVEPVAGLDHPRQMLFVQSVVHRTLRYREDLQTWGEADYWASAAETLSRGGGDCEDLAIVKYQALLALGFAPSDLVLSVGRDLARGDHALLLVREGGTWWVLDDKYSRPVRSDNLTGFEPVMSFSGASAQWLHGRRSALDGDPIPAARR